MKTLSDSGGAICRRCRCLTASLFVTVGHYYNEKHGLDVTEVALLVAHCKTSGENPFDSTIVCLSTSHQTLSPESKVKGASWWRRRESNPNQSSEDNPTDSDTSRTEVVQNRYKDPSNTELPAKTAAKGETLPEHIPHTSDTSLCVTSVPGDPPRTGPLPKSIPAVVIARLRKWEELPDHVRMAVVALLEAVDPATNR